MARTLAAVAREVQGRLVGADQAVRRRDDGHARARRRARCSSRSPAIVSTATTSSTRRSRKAPPARSCRGSPRRRCRRSRSATRAALSARWRARGARSFSIPVVAVTGSSGKTTVKELVAAILGVSRSICVTQGNLNNDIGVPLTLMRLTAEHDALVIELGANHAGEIDYLASLAQPTVGVITNAAAAHLEGFGSLRGVCEAKGELLDHLPRAGTAVLNADDQFRSDWVARSRCEFTVTFGFARARRLPRARRAALHGDGLRVPHAPARRRGGRRLAAAARPAERRERARGRGRRASRRRQHRGHRRRARARGAGARSAARRAGPQRRDDHRRQLQREPRLRARGARPPRGA